MSEVPPAKLCLNPDCTRKNQVKLGNWCTAKECRAVRGVASAVSYSTSDWRVGYARIIWDILGYSGIYGALCFFGRIRLRRKEGVTQIRIRESKRGR